MQECVKKLLSVFVSSEFKSTSLNGSLHTFGHKVFKSVSTDSFYVPDRPNYFLVNRYILDTIESH